MKKQTKQEAQRAEDLLTLCALANAILDTDEEARVWCRGIGTTPSKLEKIYERVKKLAFDSPA